MWRITTPHLLVFWYDILHAIAELNKASHCIGVTDTFKDSAVSIVMIL